MDHLDSDEVKLHRTLRQFSYINFFFSRNRFLTRKYLLSHIIWNNLQRCSVLDVGAGGGDYALWLRREGLRRGVDIRITCLDSDPRVISFLRKAVAHEPGITVFQGSVFDITSMGGSFEYVFANHFLHHLPEEHLPRALHMIDQVASRGFLINDLVRSQTSYVLFTLFGLVCTPRSFSLTDGRLSIRRAFRREELVPLVESLPGAKIGMVRPGRVYLYRFR